MEISSDDSDYEPAPMSKPQPTRSPPPIPPPRSMTFSGPSPSRSLADRDRSMRSPHLNSLFHTMRMSIGVDLKVSQPEGPVQISQFITQHSAMLPCQVKLLRESPPLLPPFPIDGLLNLHFIKHVKVVLMTDSASGEVISVPLNSAAKLSVLYDPDSNIEVAMNGYYYNNVRDLIARKPIPLLIKATRTYQGGTALSSVTEGEILRIIGTKTFLRTKQLRVSNIRGETKYLNEKCAGSFTTAPAQLSLPVSSLLDLGIGFPATVVFTEIPSLGSTYVMERTAGETSLIASDLSQQTRELSFFEISSDLKAQVEVVELDFLSKQELLSATETLFCSFFTSARPVLSDQHVRQGLRDQVLQGREQEGVQLVQPISIDVQPSDQYFTMTTPDSLPEMPATEQSEAVEESEDESDGIYAVLSSLPTAQGSCEGSLNFLQPPTQERFRMSCWTETENSSGTRDSGASLQEAAVHSIVRDLASHIDKLSVAYTEQLSTILNELDQLRMIVTDIQKDMKHLQNAQPVTDERSSQNRRTIADMNCTQVCITANLFYAIMSLLSPGSQYA